MFEVDPGYAAFKREIAGNLRRLIAEDGRSYRQLEDDCGISRTVVGHYASADTCPSLVMAVRLCDGMGRDISELVGDAGMHLKARRRRYEGVRDDLQERR